MKNMLLQDLSDEWCASFLSKCRTRSFRSTEPVLTQDGPCPFVILIARGVLEVAASDPDGHESVLHCAGPGEVVGDFEAVAQLPVLATCRALPGSEIYLAPAGLVIESLANPTFARNYARLFHGRMAFINALHARSKHLPVEARICTCLGTLSRHDPVIRRSQSYVAEMVGCSRQTVNRCLGQLRDDGIVALRKGVIEVCDPTRLASRWS